MAHLFESTSREPVMVGICGPAGSGKTTLGRQIASMALGQLWSFADPLRTICSTLVPELATQIHDRSQFAKSTPLPEHWHAMGLNDVRDLLQHVGTECMRDGLCDGVWLAALRSRINVAREKHACPEVIVLDDVRFDNEAAFVRASGMVIHLRRRGVDQSTQQASHRSEVPPMVMPTDRVYSPQDLGEVLIIARDIVDHLKNAGLLTRKDAA